MKNADKVIERIWHSRVVIHRIDFTRCLSFSRYDTLLPGEECIGWHHRLNRYQFMDKLAVRDGQGDLACCSPWGHKESDMIERLN